MSETPSANAPKLYTLTEVSQLTGISMPTLQRYKKLYQGRIPSEGRGRSQRYPEEALDVFRQLKKENIGRRGRPRKTASGGGAAEAKARPVATRRKRGRRSGAQGASKAAPKSSGELITLTEVCQLTGISYPTLLRYVKTHIDELPHEGHGRARRFLPEAVEVFKRLRGETKRGRQSKSAKAAAMKEATRQMPARRGPGRPKKATVAVQSLDGQLDERIKQLEKSNKELERALAKLEKKLDQPFKVVIQRK